MMNPSHTGDKRGLSLVELLMSVTIMAAITTVAASALWTGMEAHAYAIARSNLFREGILAMERMTDGLRKSTYVMVPNAFVTTRETLVYSGGINDDNDFYFGDAPNFPRIDEDPGSDMTADAKTGVINIDDDGDGTVDDAGSNGDDDEDGVANEETLNGIDDDGDGNIDEDLLADINGDGFAGFQNMDDDGDGTVDNGAGAEDDDEDGAINEDPLNPVVFWFDGTNQLFERDPTTGVDTLLSDQVSSFQVTYEPETATTGTRLRIDLSLGNALGDTAIFSEYVFPRNVHQRTGKRVR